MMMVRKLMEELGGNGGKRLFSLAAGALIGVLCSFTVNCTLVEISINPFFAVYFGMLFLLIAGVVIWRIRSGTHPQPTMLMCFAGMIMLSGCMCFMLENKWFMRLSPTNKVPAYSLLGASVTFALLFSLVDLINYFSTTCSDTYSIRPLVETEKQVYLVVVTSVGMGLVFGAIFGLLDVEDESLAHIRIALMREESICYPIGAIVGAGASYYNQKIRESSGAYSFDPLKDDEWDDEV